MLSVLLYLIAGGALAHGLTGVADPPGSEICVCANESDAEGTIDPCSNGTYYTAERRSGAGVSEAKLVSIVKIERLLARLRAELAMGSE